MGTITTGVGLYSGLDYASLVDQLIALDAAPRDQIVTRISNIDAQRSAYMDISARISAVLARIKTLTKPSFFRTNVASSSNSAVMSATAGEGAEAGSYSFVVRSLATRHQLLSRGFSSPTASVPAGTFTIESSQARVNQETTLDELNGYTGVQRGSLRIIDGEGNEAVISIGDARTLDDVLDRINAADIDVTAELRGEGIVLQDTSGGSGGIRVREVDGGHTAADLGFGAGHTFDAGGELTGSDVLFLSETTPLDALNDGLGIRRAAAGTDFTIQSSTPGVQVKVELSEILKGSTKLARLNHGAGVELGSIRITARNGVTTEVDLSEAETVQDIKDTIEGAVSGVSLVMAGDHLVLSDTSGATDSDLVVQDASGHAARDLGILGTATSTKITGRQILHVDTMADVIAAINYGEGNVTDEGGTPVIEAFLDSQTHRLTIRDNGGGTFPETIIQAGESSQALYDLGFEPGEYDATGNGLASKRVMGGINTTMLKTLNGGNGFTGGTIHIAANGAAADVDLSGAETLRDVIDRINEASATHGLGIEALADSAGTRLVINSTTDDPGTITISDVDGDFAEATGLAGSAEHLRSANLQRQYMNENTLLDDLNGGDGVTLGKMRITNSNGAVSVINLATDGAETLGDVIDAINALNGVEARINDTGDGLVIIDTAGGTGKLTIEEDGSSTAADLNLLGTADEDRLDGSFEFEITSHGGETLSDLVSQINGTTLAKASLINDGSAVAPYRLSITSRMTGRVGELILDGGDTDFDFATMTRAQDASVVLGDSVNGGVLVTSSNNTLTDVVPGLTLNLTAVDDEPVTITVDRDLSTLTTTLAGMVESYNSLMDRIDELSGYNAETEEAGILLGDGTLQLVETRLMRSFNGSVSGAGSLITRLSQVGVKLSEGQLTFDETKFLEAYNEDPEDVIRFFTAEDNGLAVKLEDQLEYMTESQGLLDRRDSALESQREMLSTRVEQLNELLEAKRERMLNQFITMEQTLGQLQSQQTALQNLSDSISSMYSS
ncbi:MAG: flagellar filament capping protein FliD [Phycisphaerae bacterium]